MLHKFVRNSQVKLLLFCMSTWHKLGSSEKKESYLRKCSYKTGQWQICGPFSWLMIDMGRSSPQWAVQLLGRWSWCIWESKLSKPASRVPHGLCFSSCFQVVPALNSYPDFTQWWSVTDHKPFSLQVACHHGVLTPLETLSWSLWSPSPET